MKKAILILIILSLAGLVPAYAATDTNDKRKGSRARITKRHVVKQTGICTGCCDPCYNDDVGTWRKRGHRKAKRKIIKRH